MGAVVSFREHTRRAPAARARHVDPVLIEVVEALQALGGGAHRQTVADEVLLRRTGRNAPVTLAARQAVYGSVDVYLSGLAARRRAQPLLWRPLGPDSYRWALTGAGEALLRPSTPAARRVR
jgi:hypothetical protein